MYGLLIAEDELIERMVLKKTLENKLGDRCRIYEAQNGREAVELFDQEDIQIVILDIAMPSMNGIEAAQRIRKKCPECCLIFLTAYDRFEYAQKAVSVHAMEYLLKPYSQKEILEVVEEAIQIAGRMEKQPPKEEVVMSEAVWEESGEGTSARLKVMLSMIEEYIRKNYMKDISMSDGARAVNYSEPYFCKMFKQQFGQNFTSYLAQYRIKEAKRLLMQPNVNVKEVGEKVGYPDSSYFTKVFRRQTGLSPSEYRMNVVKEFQM